MIERLHEVLRLEPETGRLFWRVRTGNRAKVGAEAGHFVASSGYRMVRIDNKPIQSHRIVFAMLHGRWPSHEIDHIDGDRANNRPSNLREATSAQNKCNRPVRSDSASGLKGVDWLKRDRKWRARIRVGGETKILGRFNDPELAALAYAVAADRYHGAFARAA